MAAESHLDEEAIGRLGDGIVARLLLTLPSEERGKYIAVDVHSEEFEVDRDDYASVMRLRARRPDAEIWLGRVGEPTAYRMGWFDDAGRGERA